MAKYSKDAGQKVERAMHEMKEGKLKSGRSGKKVTNPKQAIAIGLSEARKKGAKVPKKAASKKTTAKKASPKKVAVKKAPGKKVVSKKAAKKSSPTKVASKNTVAKKSPKKTGRRR
jgi:hypothetical protein